MLSAFDSWLGRELVCPLDRLNLLPDRKELVCPAGHRYPVVDGIPIMLVPDVKQTHPAALRSLEYADDWTEPTKQLEIMEDSVQIDPFVQKEIAATNGRMYRPLVGKLTEYPVPTLRVPRAWGREERFLELGCNWGRWCIAAGRLGYRPVGIDPSLEAIRTAYRVARQLGVEGRYIVGDARHLPFRNNTFPVVFSYSVLQHFAKADSVLAFREAGRVLEEGGMAMVQMPNVFGIRCLYYQVRRGFRATREFEVRYWTPWGLRATVGRFIGPVRLSADGYLTLNSQPSEAHLLPRRFRCVVKTSEFLRAISARVQLLVYFADSLYAVASKGAPTRAENVAS